jgi:hypothetical protein
MDMVAGSPRYTQGWDYRWVNAGIRGNDNRYTIFFTHPALRANMLYDMETLKAALESESSSLIPAEILRQAMESCPIKTVSAA